MRFLPALLAAAMLIGVELERTNAPWWLALVGVVALSFLGFSLSVLERKLDA